MLPSLLVSHLLKCLWCRNPITVDRLDRSTERKPSHPLGNGWPRPLPWILSHLLGFLKAGGIIISLIKPQFEVGKGQVGRGGIVRDESQRQGVLQQIVRFAADLELRVLKTLDCPVRGKKGKQYH
jgi:hypothetical protein